MVNQLVEFAPQSAWFSEIIPPTCSKKIASWLYDHNSLTKKLELQHPIFHVQLQQQVQIPPNIKLSGYFNKEKMIFVREVLLYSNNLPVVFAQTEIPFSTLDHTQVALAELGSQSLGKILFQDPSMLRGQIEVSEFSIGSAFHQMSQKLQQTANYPLWARRSLFYLNQKPLLVSELFLPASGIYQ